MIDPAIYVINIKHAVKELQELVAHGEAQKDRMDQIFVLSQEISEDAANLRIWAESKLRKL